MRMLPANTDSIRKAESDYFIASKTERNLISQSKPLGHQLLQESIQFVPAKESGEAEGHLHCLRF